MKKRLIFISIILAALLCPRVLGSAYTESGDGTLNVSAVSAEQVRICSAVLLDGFEENETDRAPDEGTVADITVASPFEGENCLMIAGNGSAGVTFEMTKKRNTANTRSAVICAYVEPVDGAEFEIEMCVRGSKKSFTGRSKLEAGVWCAAYLPIPGDAINLTDIHITVSSGENVRVKCSLDWLHTALVDGMPDRLPFFASEYEPSKGELSLEDGVMRFKPTGTSARLESSYCGYMTGGVYNCISVRLVNESDADELTLRLKLDGQRSYQEENAHTLKLTKGEQICNFPIGGFRSGTVVEQLRFDLPRNTDGVITLKSVGFSVYRFPVDYKGTVTATAEGDVIVISGNMPDYPSSAKNVRLYRLPVGADEEQPGAVDSEPYAEAGVSGSFRFEIPRYDEGRDNALYKYTVVYEGKNSSETAGVAYVGGGFTAVSLPYKGMTAPERVADIYELLPGAVYVDADAGALFDDNGETSVEYGDFKHGLSDAELQRYDAIIDRCRAENVPAVLDLRFSPFPGADKYVFTDGVDAVPDLTSYEGTANFYAVLRFFAERYKDGIAAVILPGPLDSEGIAGVLGAGADGMEKYASSVIRAAAAALEGTGVGVIVRVTSDGAGDFLQMLRKDLPNEPLTAAAFCEDEGSAKAFAQAAADAGVSCVIEADAGDAASLIRLFYVNEHRAAAIRAENVTADATSSALFSVIDTRDGVSASDGLKLPEFPGGVGAVYTDIIKRTKIYENRGYTEPTELPQVLTTVTEGGDCEAWTPFDGCANVYADELYGEPSTSLTFDLSSGPGCARCTTPPLDGTVYLRLCVDYLPEGSDTVDVTVRLRGENGFVSSVLRMENGKVTSAALDPGDIGAVTSVDLSPSGDAGTPRISVLGIYTVDKTSSETVPEQSAETLPPPETQIFETETRQTAPIEKKENDIPLYAVTIGVMLGMFAVCGAVIFILKKVDAAKKRENTEEDTED